MRLADLLSAEGLQESPPSSYCSLFRVILFNLEIGLDRGHVDRDAAKGVFQELLDALEAVDSKVSAIHIDRVYEKLAAILIRDAPALFFCRTDPLASHLEEHPITYQPSWAFKFWVDDTIHEARNEVHSPADVATLVRTFEQGESLRPEAKVGYPVLWLAPNVGAVRECLDAASHLRYDLGLGALEASGYAQSLRDLLGLQRRVFPERAIAMVANGTIGELQASAESLTLTRADEPSRRPFAAPTQFDAGEYPRFRHWPTSDGLVEADYGRTWDLADDAAGSTGAPELVSEPLALEDMRRVISLGPILSRGPTEHEATTLDLAFANELCGDATIASLVNALSLRLEL